MENESKKELEKFLENLEGSQREDWKTVIEKEKENFNQIKKEIRLKQDELGTLVRQKKARTITDDEFSSRTRIIQQELYELEAKILRMRLRHAR